jgi:hypothetical protein
MEKLKLSKELSEKTVSLQINGLVAQDKTIQQAVDYVNAMSSFDAHLAFYILWNAIGKDYVLVPRESVEAADE